MGEHAAARALMIRELAGRGFLASSYVYLMLAHTEQHQAEFLSALDGALSEVESALSEGCISEMASGVEANQFARLT